MTVSFHATSAIFIDTMGWELGTRNLHQRPRRLKRLLFARIYSQKKKNCRQNKTTLTQKNDKMCHVAKVMLEQSTNKGGTRHLVMVSSERSRRVRFQCDRDNNNNVVVAVHHDTVPMTKEEFQAYFMQPQDFERCNQGTKDSLLKWVQHKKEKTPFDEEENSIRGLEDYLDHMKNAKCPNKGRAGQNLNHIQTVLKEVRQQRMNSNNITEKIRCISERSSRVALERAIRLAIQDENDSYSSTASRTLLSQSLLEPMDVSRIRRVENVDWRNVVCSKHPVQSPKEQPKEPSSPSNKKPRRFLGFMKR